jgi:hypothetical protein
VFSISQPKDNGCEGQHPKVVNGAFLIPSGNAPELLQPIDQPLHNVPLPIASLVKVPSSPLPLLASDHRSDTSLAQVPPNLPTAIPPIPDYSFGSDAWFPLPHPLDRPRLHQRLEDGLLMPLPRRDQQGDRLPSTFCSQVDFGTEASLAPS